MVDNSVYINIDEIEKPNAKQMTREQAGLRPLPTNTGTGNIDTNRKRSRGNRDNNKNVTPVVQEVAPAPIEPIPVQQQRPNVELYYDINDQTKQYAREIGQYGNKFERVPNSVTNPQNVLANTNKGVGYIEQGTSGEKVNIYYDIEDKSKQFTRPAGDYTAPLKPVNPKTYSVTVPSENKDYESQTNTYSYIIDPDTVTSNVNEKTENPKYGLSNIAWEESFSNLPYILTKVEGASGTRPSTRYGTGKDEKITFDVYINSKGNQFLKYLEKPGEKVVDFLFFNPQTGKTNTDSIAYKVLTKKVPFNTFDTAKSIFFAPYMATGTQTYYNIFGNEVVKTGAKQIYLSPLETVNIPTNVANLAKTPYKSVGKVVAKSGDDIIVREDFIRDGIGASSRTKTITTLYRTGEDRYAAFTKGIAYIKADSLSGNSFLYARPFTFQGTILNVEPIATSVKGSVFSKELKDVYKGDISGKYYGLGSNNPKDVPITTGISKSGTDYTDTISLNPKASLYKIGKIRITSPTSEIDTPLSYDFLGGGRIYELGYKAKTGLSATIIKPKTEIISAPANEETIKRLSQIAASEGIVRETVKKTAEASTSQYPQIFSVATPIEKFSLFSSTPSTSSSIGSSSAVVSFFPRTRTSSSSVQEPINDFVIKEETILNPRQVVSTVNDVDVIKDVRQSSSSGSSFSQSSQQTQELIQIPAQTQRQSQSFRNVQRYDLFSASASISDVGFNTPKNNRIVSGFPKISGKRFSIFEKVKQAYNVVVYRKGKEQTIARGLPEGLAKKAGVKGVLANLRASFKIKPAGETEIEDIEYKIPKGFRLSKVDKNRYVQEKNTRFGSGGETKEAQFFRKVKKGKVKWFG